MIFGWDGAAQTLLLTTSGLQYSVPFDRTRGALSFNVPPRDPFGRALTSGDMLRIATLDGQVVMDVPMTGAHAAFYAAESACFQ